MTRAFFSSRLLTMSLLVFLAACGGGKGGSSSGGGTTIYRGSETVYVTSPGLGSSQPSTFALTVSITGRSVTITDVDGALFKGSVSGSAFTAKGVLRLPPVGNGISCPSSIELTYEGNINNNNVTGDLRSNLFSCTGGGRAIQFRVQGAFTANRNARR